MLQPNKIDKETLQQLMKRNGFLSFSFIAWNWLLVAGAIALSLYTQHWLIYILSVWFIGIRMVALAEVFGHDSVHNNLFKRKSLNRILDFLWFLPLFESWEGYREEHTRHHRVLLTPNDPAWQDYKRWGLLEKNAQKKVFWMWFIRPFLLFDTWYLMKSIASSLWEDKTYRHKILSFWVLALASIFALSGWQGLQILALYWLVPFLWVYPAIIFWSEIGEHFGVQGDITRNTYGFMEWFMISPHNDRFHYVHHLYPNIPWFNMHKACFMIFDKEKVPASYGFLDLYRQVRRGTQLHAKEATAK